VTVRWTWFVLALFALERMARAEQTDWTSATLELERAEGAEECIEAAALEQAVQSRLGRTVFVQRSQADVVVSGRLRRAAGGWSAELVLHSQGGKPLGTRVLNTQAAHCSSLDDSLALALALMLDVPRDELGLRSSAAAEPQAPPTTPVELPRDTPARREPWHGELSALGVAGLGVLPGLALGVRLSVGVEPPRFWPVELDGTWWPARDATDGDGGVELALMAVGLFVCPLDLEAGSFGLSGCVGQQVGRLGASGYGFDQNRQRSTLAFAPALRTRASLRVAGPLRLRAGLGVELSVVRKRFVYERPDGTRSGLFRVAPAAGVAELGLGLRF
jgi:hypothetical protein